MKDRIITVYYAPDLPPFGKYYTAYALDEDNNLVWVTKLSTDDPVLLDEIDDWYDECVQDVPDIPEPLNKEDYEIDYNSEDRRFIGEIKLRYTNE